MDDVLEMSAVEVRRIQVQLHAVKHCSCCKHLLPISRFEVPDPKEHRECIECREHNRDIERRYVAKKRSARLVA
jgi:hypothetical protein